MLNPSNAFCPVKVIRDKYLSLVFSAEDICERINSGISLNGTLYL